MAPQHHNLRPPYGLLILLAAIYAAAELLLVLTAGRYFAWGRAELLLFHALRPWLLLAAAVAMTGFALRSRLVFYAAALLLAALAEGLFVIGLGAPPPMAEAARGLAGAALLLVVADPLLEIGRRLRGRAGLAAAAVLLASLILLSPVSRIYQRVVIPPAPALDAGAPRPPLMLLTGLPLVWGESGAFDPASRPAASYAALKERFTLRLLDSIDPATLGQGRLLLIAQPRAPAPAELAALDAWVRNGGRALILTDPDLVWPSPYPIGDPRRPPAVGTLGPLLAHWGIGMAAPGAPGPMVEDVAERGVVRRLAMAAPGTLTAEGDGCRVDRIWRARCRIGRGQALVIADADLLRDAAWVAPVANGDAPHARLADNPLLVAEWLQALAGQGEGARAPEVAWLRSDADRALAILLGLLPIILAAAAGLVLRRRAGKILPDLSTALPNVNKTSATCQNI